MSLKGYLYNEIVSNDESLDCAKDFITAGLQSGSLVPRTSKTFLFEKIKEATRFVESNAQVGKIVVTL